jgi:hypothetical protein
MEEFKNEGLSQFEGDKANLSEVYVGGTLHPTNKSEPPCDDEDMYDDITGNTFKIGC